MCMPNALNAIVQRKGQERVSETLDKDSVWCVVSIYYFELLQSIGWIP